MAVRRPLVILDNNKIGILPEEDVVGGVDGYENLIEVNVSLGDATAVTSTGTYDQVIEIDPSMGNSAILRMLALVAPPTSQVAPVSTTTVQVSTTTNYDENLASISLASGERSKVEEKNLTANLVSGQRFYIRVSQAGMHSNLSLRAVINIT